MVWTDAENTHCCCASHQAWDGLVCRCTVGSNVACRSVWSSVPSELLRAALPMFLRTEIVSLQGRSRSLVTLHDENCAQWWIDGARCCPVLCFIPGWWSAFLLSPKLRISRRFVTRMPTAYYTEWTNA
jgi:hypothetical protein